jgi:hypothetical protein
LGTRLSAKLGFGGVDESAGAVPIEALGKQSFQDKCVTKLELGHEGSESSEPQSRKTMDLFP